MGESLHIDRRHWPFRGSIEPTTAVEAAFTFPVVTQPGAARDAADTRKDA